VDEEYESKTIEELLADTETASKLHQRAKMIPDTSCLPLQGSLGMNRIQLPSGFSLEQFLGCFGKGPKWEKALGPIGVRSSTAILQQTLPDFSELLHNLDAFARKSVQNHLLAFIRSHAKKRWHRKKVGHHIFDFRNQQKTS
jgi:hypothetical protein